MTGAGRSWLRAGTLYAALDRLQAYGLVSADREEVVDGRLRRYCKLTEDRSRPAFELPERQARPRSETTHLSNEFPGRC